MTTKADKKAIEFIADCSLKRLKPFQRNPRKNDPAVDVVAKSIEKFGAVAPIIVNGDFEICAGHTRFKAATQIGRETFPVIVVPTLTGDDFIGYNIADNQTATIAEWDDKALATLIQELDWSDFDLDALGFEDDELQRVMASLESGGQTDPDEVPEPPKVAVSKPGDLWLCGEHRLLCGDATKQEDARRLLDGAVPLLMVTDPPYGVSYDPTWRGRDLAARKKPKRTGKVTADDRDGWLEAWEWFPGDVMYVWHPPGAKSVRFFNDIVDAGFEIRTQIIWANPQLVISRGHYHVQHEPCWYAVRKGATGHWGGSRKESTLWEIPNACAFRGKKDDDADTNHSTQKPLECMARPIRNHKASKVYDPFLGSGTTLIACEQLGRACYGIEIEPIYVDVAVKRWENFTGQKATLESTGEEFPEQEAA